MKITTLGMMLFATLFVQHAMADEMVECASQNYQPQTCYYQGGHDAEVTLALQESTPGSRGGTCIEGTDWTAFDGQITVQNGCRAQFRISYGHGGGGWRPPGHRPGHGGSLSVECDSIGNQPNQCQMPWGRVQNVSVQSQLSREKHGRGTCYQGRDWSWDSRFIYVQNGCRAVFRVDMF